MAAEGPLVSMQLKMLAHDGLKIKMAFSICQPFTIRKKKLIAFFCLEVELEIITGAQLENEA